MGVKAWEWHWDVGGRARVSYGYRDLKCKRGRGELGIRPWHVWYGNEFAKSWFDDENPEEDREEAPPTDQEFVGKSSEIGDATSDSSSDLGGDENYEDFLISDYDEHLDTRDADL